MGFAETVERWNLRYESVPEEWRLQTVLWPLLIIGAINMLLTVSTGFPFGLLLLLAILAIAILRVPYAMGWVTPAAADAMAGDAAAGPAKPRISIAAVPWVWEINMWYDGLPEHRRPWVILAVLAVAGAINMVLTINHGFSFGILFLLALLALILIRAPYAAGWLLPPPMPQDRLAAAMPPGQITQDTMAPAAPMHVVEPAPSVMHEAPADIGAEPRPMPLIHPDDRPKDTPA